MRVVPGSHISPLHESLSPLHSQLANADPSDMPDAIAAQLEAGGFLDALGGSGAAVPAHAVETRLGDVVLFSHQCWHASFFGGTHRRFFAMGYKAVRSNQLNCTRRPLESELPFPKTPAIILPMPTGAEHSRAAQARGDVSGAAGAHAAGAALLCGRGGGAAEPLALR